MSQGGRTSARRSGEIQWGHELPLPASENVSAAQKVVIVAEQLMGLDSGEYELRNHAGNGFCWGSATCAGFMPGLLRSFTVESTPFEGAGPSSCAHDRNVEAVARDSAFGVAPTPVALPEDAVAGRDALSSVVWLAMDAGRKASAGSHPNLDKMPMVCQRAQTPSTASECI